MEVLPISHLLFFSYFLCIITVGLGCHPNDRAALLNFSRQLQPNPWPAANESSDCCRWEGVRCARSSSMPTNSRRVIELELPNKGLHGTISPSLGRLEYLSLLALPQNALYGSIPEALFTVQSLKLIELESNNLSGRLSPKIGNLSALFYLSIYDNNLSGTIPDVFHGLSGKILGFFIVSSNNFTGQLPPSLFTCLLLQVLDLGYNSLTVRADDNFSSLENLRALYLESNRFMDGIPHNIFSCRKLVELGLTMNNLHGEFPHQLSRLHSLELFLIGGNGLSNITLMLTVLGRCSNLTVLSVDGNFNDEIMPNDGTWEFPKLTTLSIRDSNLSGSIPLWLSRCSKLVQLGLSGNHLGGTIPAWLGNLKHLFQLYLSDNMLTGDIPPGLAPLGSPAFSNAVKAKSYYGIMASELDFSNNLLNGTGWRALGNLKHLGKLNLSGNSLSGWIPDKFSDMNDLQVLDLSSNNISGRIPLSLQDLTFLGKFNVANNRLEGNIPTGGQFLTFPCSSFYGNPKLNLASFPLCNQSTQHVPNIPGLLPPQFSTTMEHQGYRFSDMVLPFGLGTLIGFFLACWWMWHFLA